MENIRNFSIIAHVDHGKSTLADRLLEHTGTIEKRKMQEQVLDRMDLERERGITIKMQPVSIEYKKDDVVYMLNIIDTPGHIDFSYEVSRSLRAVEGVLLLVDSTQGIQAQTISVLEMAQDLNLTIIPVLTKIDMDLARVDEVSLEVAELLGCGIESIVPVSGKTGEGIEHLLEKIISVFPSPRKEEDAKPRALVFDFSYTNHTGINAFARVFSGSFKKGDSLLLHEVGARFSLKEVGVFKPDMIATGDLGEGMIGYFTTGIKEPGTAVVGDTILQEKTKAPPFSGYQEVAPVIWVSIYPQNADAHRSLYQTLQEVRLTDAAFTFEEEKSTVLGKGFRCGFLGMLHFETIVERVRRQSGVELIVTAPSTDFKVTGKDGKTDIIATPSKFPDAHEVQSVTEPWVAVNIIVPTEHTATVTQLFQEYEGFVSSVDDFKNNRNIVHAEIPLRELMRQFFDRLKSDTSGYASLSYKRIGYREADVTRMDILLAEEEFPAFSSIVSRVRGEREARKIVNILYETMPRELFVVKIQAKIDGRIVASKTLSALRKDVTAKLYGGDITRKMKLREKQKKGKQKRGLEAKVNVSHDTFLKVIQKRST